jgi:hypothetical protein
MNNTSGPKEFCFVKQIGAQSFVRKMLIDEQVNSPFRVLIIDWVKGENDEYKQVKHNEEEHESIAAAEECLNNLSFEARRDGWEWPENGLCPV